MNNKEYIQHYKDYEKYVNSDDCNEEMIDYRGIKYKYQLNRWELYFIDYLLDNNYDVKIKNKYNSKTVFEVSKDSITENYEISSLFQYNGMWKICETFEDYFRKSKIIKEHLKNNPTS